ncbi:helix-turn-helix domain-containing protein [Paenactinomyces guangxiensis]|uniref:Helix-turn-helix domain-containing protein n=1 Tax=Paenactinomyces guangxiensis TaxID=1490290 RepID=A0A7W1WNE9_9BACL|nr:helix-turn-helix domain-containing protein [Paenactinomyces guangxiensis]MBA4493101.1 helix-turn-helix domain-containing protein [Paenactinomyces guangxiensis]MBH8590049.1 helix-turn-helix domain-containing protein [Paenactinomyces guangxiensis]
MLRTYKFRLYPKEQQERIDFTLERCRLLYIAFWTNGFMPTERKGRLCPTMIRRRHFPLGKRRSVFLPERMRKLPISGRITRIGSVISW